MNIFDLTTHSSLDLSRLGMAVETGIAECGNQKGLMELKETLISYRSIVEQAYKKACERESDQFASQVVKEHFTDLETL